MLICSLILCSALDLHLRSGVLGRVSYWLKGLPLHCCAHWVSKKIIVAKKVSSQTTETTKILCLEILCSAVTTYDRVKVVG